MSLHCPDSIFALLRIMRRRLVVNAFFSHAARATLFFLGVLVLLRSVVWWRGDFRPDFSSLPVMLSWPFVFGTLASLILLLLRRPSLEVTAAIVDNRLDSRDRLL